MNKFKQNLVPIMLDDFETKEISGKYIPGYYAITIDANDNPSVITEWNKQSQGALYHEHIHFLQNISTTIGILFSQEKYCRIKSLIHYIQKNPGPHQIPLSNSLSTEFNERKSCINFILGDVGVSNINVSQQEQNKYNVNNIYYSSLPFLKKYFSNVPGEIVKLELTHPTLPSQKYNFGESAISETIAHLIEKKFYAKGDVNKYPYESAIAVLDHLVPSHNYTDEMVIALCDVSLMYPYPGWAFCELIKFMKSEGFQPANGRSIIDFGYKKFKDWGVDLEVICENAISGIKKDIALIFQGQNFAPTIKWIQEVIEKGFELRRNNQYLFLDIYNSQTPLGSFHQSLVAKVGVPLNIDNEDKLQVVLPESMKDLSKNVHPQLLLLARQIDEFLCQGHIPCQHPEIGKRRTFECRMFTESEDICNQCAGRPWLTVNLSEKCPFAIMWKNLHFDKVEFTINGQSIS